MNVSFLAIFASSNIKNFTFFLKNQANTLIIAGLFSVFNQVMFYLL